VRNQGNRGLGLCRGRRGVSSWGGVRRWRRDARRWMRRVRGVGCGGSGGDGSGKGIFLGAERVLLVLWGGFLGGWGGWVGGWVGGGRVEDLVW